MKPKRLDLTGVRAFAFTTLLTAGCVAGPEYQPIQVRNTALIPVARLSKSLHSTDRTDLAFEGGLTRIGSSGELNIVGNGTARLGNTTFSASSPVTSNNHLTVFDTSLRFQHAVRALPVGFDLGAGFAYAKLNASLSSGSATSWESISSPALQLRFGAVWFISPKDRFNASLTGYTTRATFSSLNSYELSYSRVLAKHIVVRGGYQSWNIDSLGAGRSEIDAHIQGPAIGVSFNF